MLLIINHASVREVTKNSGGGGENSQGGGQRAGAWRQKSRKGKKIKNGKFEEFLFLCFDFGYGFDFE